MKTRHPTATLTIDEAVKLRLLVRELGAKEAAKTVGLADLQTLFKAASESPVSRLTAEVVRHRLERI